MSNFSDPDPSQPINETVIPEEHLAVVSADAPPSDANAMMVEEQAAPTPAAPRPPVALSIRFDVIQTVRLAGIFLPDGRPERKHPGCPALRGRAPAVALVTAYGLNEIRLQLEK